MYGPYTLLAAFLLDGQRTARLASTAVKPRSQSHANEALRPEQGEASEAAAGPTLGHVDPSGAATAPTGQRGTPAPLLLPAQAAAGPDRVPLLVDAEAAAELLSISRAHFLALHRRGLVPAPVRLGRCCRWPVVELVAWVAAHCPPLAKWVGVRDSGAKGGRR